MNVNSEDGAARVSEKKRIRRTPEEARALILNVAAERLRTMGLEGLNIAGVAKAAGMSHGTVIHHFGSTGAMREALLATMTQQLLQDVMTALDHHEPTDKLLQRLFDTLSRDGHGRLLAWLALDRQTSDVENQGINAEPPGQTGNLFSTIVQSIAEESESESEAKQIVFLVALAAMGLSISGDSLPRLLDMSANETQAFPGWLADRLSAF